MTIIILKEFAEYSHFCELSKQWIYKHNERTYAVDKYGVHEIN